MGLIVIHVEIFAYKVTLGKNSHLEISQYGRYYYSDCYCFQILAHTKGLLSHLQRKEKRKYEIQCKSKVRALFIDKYINYK